MLKNFNKNESSCNICVKLFRWCKIENVSVKTIHQDPFEWKKIAVYAKESREAPKEFTDKETNLVYIVTVHKDASFTKQLAHWNGSPTVNVKATERARCELIVQADDEDVSI